MERLANLFAEIVVKLGRLSLLELYYFVSFDGTGFEVFMAFRMLEDAHPEAEASLSILSCPKK